MQAQICDRCLSDNMTVLAPVATSDGYQVPESHYNGICYFKVLKFVSLWINAFVNYNDIFVIL